MVKKALLVPSVNGFGHLRRCLSIANSLTARNYHCSIMWNYSVRIPTWATEFCSKYNIRMIMRDTPLNDEGPNFRKKNSYGSPDLHKEIETFNLLIADTVTWPLDMNNEVVFLAQFYWELYYTKCFNENIIDVKKIKQISKNVKTFGMELFVWDEMKDFLNFTPIPILDYWNLRANKSVRNEEILVSRSGAGNGNISATPHWMRSLENLNGMENYINSQNRRPLGVVCRAGLGIISECISSKVLPIFQKSDDYETELNIRKSLENGIGLSINNIQKLEFDKVRNLLFHQVDNTSWPQVISPDRFLETYLHQYL